MTTVSFKNAWKWTLKTFYHNLAFHVKQRKQNLVNISSQTISTIFLLDFTAIDTTIFNLNRAIVNNKDRKYARLINKYWSLSFIWLF